MNSKRPDFCPQRREPSRIEQPVAMVTKQAIPRMLREKIAFIISLRGGKHMLGLERKPRWFGSGAPRAASSGTILPTVTLTG
jgi:hypothetical protein